MTLPSRRIFTVAITARLRPIKHPLDPTTYPRSSFRLGVPDRRQHLHDQIGAVTIGADLIDGNVADNRVGIGIERGGPLRGVLGIRPSRLVCLDVLFGALLERYARLGYGVIDRQNRGAIVGELALQLLDPVKQLGDRALRRIGDRLRDSNATGCILGGLLLADGLLALTLRQIAPVGLQVKVQFIRDLLRLDATRVICYAESGRVLDDPALLPVGIFLRNSAHEPPETVALDAVVCHPVTRNVILICYPISGRKSIFFGSFLIVLAF